MSFTRVKLAGWAMFEVLTSAQMNQLDINVSQALDASAGGTYQPSSMIQIDGEGLGVGSEFDSTGWTPRFGLQNWERCNVQDANGFGAQINGGRYVDGYWVVCGEVGGVNGGVWFSFDDGVTFELRDMNAATGNSFNRARDVAVGSTHIVVVGHGDAGANDCGGIWTTPDLYESAASIWTFVQAPTSANNGQLWAVRYHAGSGKFITVGQDAAGTGPYIATSNDGTAAAWTLRAAPAGFAGKILHSLAVATAGPSTGVAVAASRSAHTKLAVSTDGGATWADSTSSITSGVYMVSFSPDRLLFVAVRFDSGSQSTIVYTSADGLTWTQTFSGNTDTNFRFDSAPTGQLVQWYGRAIVVGGYDSRGSGNRGRVIYSFDLGATWEVSPAVGFDSELYALIGDDNGGERLLATWNIYGSRCFRRDA